MKNSIKPFSPKDVIANLEKSLPVEVYDAVNGMLIQRYKNGVARFTQDEIIQEILRKFNARGFTTTITKQDIFDLGWLDFEEAYRKQGWTVIYDKPGYDESYVADFTFKHKE